MELRQLRYFVRTVELGSFSQAAADLGVVTSALSQQVARLEGELATRLLQRATTGVQPTEAGLAFLHQARLALRHAEAAGFAARQARLSGHVSIGMPSTTASVLGKPMILALRERHPSVRLHVVENLSGHLADMLTSRMLDLAILFRVDPARRFTVMPLLDESLFVIGRPTLAGMPADKGVRISRLGDLPLVLPSTTHTLRFVLDQAFARVRQAPNIVAEIDGLGTLLDFVAGGHAATLQPGAATFRLPPQEPFAVVPITDPGVRRATHLVSLSDDELSPAGLAARTVVADTVRRLVRERRWAGARLHDS